MKAFLLRFVSVLTATSLLLTAQGIPSVHAAVFIVNALADNNTPGDNLCTLREAIESANNAGNGDCGPNSAANDVITFSVSGTIPLTATLPNIVSGQGTLTINGGGNIVISGNNSVRVMFVNNGLLCCKDGLVPCTCGHSRRIPLTPAPLPPGEELG